MIQSNVFLEDWKQANYQLFHQMYPELTKEEIYEVLDEDIRQNFVNPDTSIHNDYQDDFLISQPMTDLYRFCKEKKPILAGNGTLFYNQDKVKSPIADLIDDRIAARKKYQKIRDTFPPESEEYEHFEMMQKEAKIRINSIYGSFGAPSFQLYNKYTAASTTGTAQSLISTTGIAFESFIGNHVKFKSLSECMVFMMNVITEEYDESLSILNIKRCNDVHVIYDLMVNQFEDGVFEESLHGDIIFDYLSSLNEEGLTRLYYKNRIYEFIKNESILNILVKIFNEIDNFNDPNKVPEEAEEDLNLLWKCVSDYVFYNHAYTERINRLKNDRREVVKVIDTDSNLIHVQPWVDFLYENLLPKCDVKMDEDTTKFACVNTLAFLVTSMLRSLLDKYCNDCHVLERYWKRINMKNEFCFSTLLLSSVKKRYVAKIILREGKPVVKAEIKGHDFKKAGVTEYVSEYMINIVNNRILNVENVDVPGILRDMQQMEDEIYESLNKGERKYLLRMNCKQREAYKNPDSMGQVLAVLAWDTIYPEQEILLPDKLDVVRVKIPNAETIKDMQYKYPKEYERIVKYLLNGPVEKIRKDGLQYLAIPNNIDGIPDFIIPYIDIDYVVSRNLGTFRSIRESLQMQDIGKDKQTFFSNIRYNTVIDI